MATLEKTRAQVLQLLADAAVSDRGALRAMGYGISTEGLFAEAAAGILRTLPRIHWIDEEIVDQARMLCELLPADYNGIQDRNYALPRGRFLVLNRWASSLLIASKPYGWSSKPFRPSVSREGIVATYEITSEECSAMRKRAHDLRDRIDGLLRSIVAPLAPEHRAVEVGRCTTHGWTFLVRYANGLPWTHVVYNSQMVHDGDERILAIFRAQFQAMMTGHLEFVRHKDVVERLQPAVDEVALKSGLPIRLRLVPAAAVNGDAYLGLVVDGYGRTGRPETTYLRSVALRRSHEMIDMTEGMLRDQRALHNAYGPEPRDERGDWSVDAPTLRRLAPTGRAREILEDFISGHVFDGAQDGLVLRANKGRIHGTFDLAPGVVWKGDRLEAADVRLSDVVASALQGRSVRSLIEHPLLGDRDVAGIAKHRSSKHGNALVVAAKPQYVPLEDVDTFISQLAPATQP